VVACLKNTQCLTKSGYNPNNTLFLGGSDWIANNTCLVPCKVSLIVELDHVERSMSF